MSKIIPLKISGALTDGGTLSVGTTEVNLSVLPSQQTGYLVLDSDKATGAEEVSFSHSGSNPVTISATTVEHSGTCNWLIDNTNGYYQDAIKNFVGVRAYLGSTLGTTVDGVLTKVALNAETYDVGSHFASSKFTAPVNGYYDIKALIRYAALPADKFIGIGIYVDGVSVAESYGTNGSNASASMIISDTIYLAANSYVELYYYQASGATTPDVVGGSGATYMTVVLNKEV